ncbi:MAG: hypothetical protein ABSA05_15300 [Opitutaceae bacterium]|jgi:hypothetical protein
MSPSVDYHHLPSVPSTQPGPRILEAFPHYFGYVAIAVAAFIAGMILGQLSGPEPSGSQTDSRPPATVQPHPRRL